MITQEQLDADKAALTAAQDLVTKDTAAFEAAQPHLSVWAEVEAHAVKYGGEAEVELKAIVAKGRSLLASIL